LEKLDVVILGETAAGLDLIKVVTISMHSAKIQVK